MQFKRRPEIDGLRTLAVFPILLFHAHLCPGGYLGVDIFFIISGYLITRIITVELTTKSFSYIKFYERRARRILPMLLFIVLICIPFAWLLFSKNQIIAFAKSALAVVFFVSNFWFAYKTDYYSPDADLIPLLHTWSLGVEEQFYILWPFVISFIWKKANKYILQILFALIIVSFLYANFMSLYNEAMNFYLLPSRIWQLSLGGFLALYEFKYDRTYKPIVASTMSWLGLIVLLASIIFMGKGGAGPNLITAIPAMATASLIWFTGDRSYVSRLLSSKIFVGCGLISYSIYLWHQPLLAFARVYNVGIMPKSMLYAYIPLTIVLSYFSWRYIEQPFRNRKRLDFKKFLILLMSVIITICSILILIIKMHGFPHRSYIPESVQRQLAESVQFDSPSIIGPNKGIYTIGSKDCTHFDFAFIGDSHANVLFPIIERATKISETCGFVDVQYACSPLLSKNDHSFLKKECAVHNKEIFEYIVNNNIKHVFLISRWQKIFLPKNRYAISIFKQDFANTISEYKKAGIKLYLLLQVPMQQRDIELSYMHIFRLPHYLQQIRLEQLSLTRDNYIQQQDAFLMEIKPFIDKDIIIVDPISYLCNESICSIGTLEDPYYIDTHHLTENGSKRLMPMFVDLFLSTKQ